MVTLDEDVAFQSNIPAPVDITVAVVYSVFGICSLFGNSTLLYVSYKKRHLLKPAEYLIINLAVSDLGLTLSLYPMAITSSFYHRWLYGRTVCSVYAFCGMLFGVCSLTTLTLLSTVCFVKVRYPLYGNGFKSPHGRLLVACAWLNALLFACSPLLHWGEYGPEPYGTACCIDWRLSNERPAARAYTVALFVLCYILPCCVIAASHAGVLLALRGSRRTLERHASRRTRASGVHIVIVKLSVAVCVGFFAAWSPYAVVSMWAAFGHIETIPPLAFAVPAMFAKSSTIYNPIVYLLLRPNFRRVMQRDLGALCLTCRTRCRCSKGREERRSKPEVRIRLHALQRQANQPPGLRDCSCMKGKGAFECCRHYPQMCVITNPEANGDPFRDAPAPPARAAKTRRERCRSLLSMLHSNRTSEIDSVHISLEMAPGHAKLAWP
ncbi:opsin 7, group member a [Betta splendens]|uniref:Opsin 7, group member a n=1 Tax=Betta splendens TaxID=158456 RepID=A0A9W2XED0_BETSP|nr:opsin 7, group member a [Betta splendens]